MIRVAIVDDQQLVRAGLRALLERAPDITVVGEAADGEDARALCQEQRPDVVLMDIRMPGTDGIEATRRITGDEQLANIQVIMLTTFDTDEHIFDAISAGAAGFLLKDAHPDDLRRAIHVVAGGEALLSPAVTRRVMNAAARTVVQPPRTDLVAGLTEREREVLYQIGCGRSNDEVAAELHITSATARTYVSRLLSKLHARDRSQLVALAYQAGLPQLRN
ncbi:response regulator transcription factor [Actinopolymorpha alba]|uniref:response regulator transcription factor n=1 Tax=Actinopolymorpha alba TaxID=533267 RepID=UPI00036B3D2F|nr:response regulator transcription factor [Actinopolymorpha alba]